jgi:glycine/D-amino acid oxidase-like deaminating enzyme
VKTTPYWLEEPRVPFAAARLGGAPDVTVVGGGVTGCSCALTLAEAGVRVRLHEAREIAGGASGRNGGFALRGGAMPYDHARAALGADRARALWRLTEVALDRIEELAGDALARVGSVRLAADAAERAALEREFDALREDGFEARWVDEPAPPLDRLYDGGIVHPGDGAFQPARWVRRLAARAAEAGAEIIERSRVEAGRVESPTTVIAIDALPSALVPTLQHTIAAIRGQVLVTEPLATQSYPRPHYAREGYDYWQQLPDGRLLVGGARDASFDTERTVVEDTTTVIQSRLEELVFALVGRLPRITHRWAGIWGETVDRLPLVGPMPGSPGTWVVAGYSGHGNVLGFACGDLVARAILGDTAPELALFDPGRFTSEAARVSGGRRDPVG